MQQVVPAQSRSKALKATLDSRKLQLFVATRGYVIGPFSKTVEKDRVQNVCAASKDRYTSYAKWLEQRRRLVRRGRPGKRPCNKALQ